MVPVGRVVSTRDVPEDDGWDGETCSIELLEPFDGSALQGLDGFSHCLVVYVFDRASWDGSRMTRRPRGNPDWPETGIFAQRAKDRPNRIGVTVCRVVAVEGTVLRVSGLDAIDGTPVLDIKPYIPAFERKEDVRLPAWVGRMMDGYF